MEDKQDLQNWIVQEWAKGLACAIEAMGASATAEYSGETPGLPPDISYRWAQEVSLAAGPSIWVAAPERSWRQVGSRCLEMLGITSPGDDEVRDTWREVLVQSLSGLASKLSALCAREVICLTGQPVSATVGDPGRQNIVLVQLDDGDPVELYFRVAPALTDACHAITAQGSAKRPARDEKRSGSGACDISRGSLAHVDMQVNLSFGRVYLTLEEVLKLAPGHIIPLNRAADAPGELKVNLRTVARGSIIESLGFYGLTLEDFGGGPTTELGRLMSSAGTEV